MGLIHIYCGDGKGKTTASIGLACRAAGSGMNVLFVQLMKGNETSELASLAKLDNIQIMRCDKDYSFTFNMDDNEKKALISCNNTLLSKAYLMAQREKIDMLIIDEFNVAYDLKLVDSKLAEKIIFDKPEHLELAVTGRNPSEKFLEAADYVSEIRAVKHPFDKNICGRKGIEF